MIDTKRYIQDKGILCPNSNCQSDQLSPNSELHVDGGEVWQEVICDTCGLEWVDHYTLTNISLNME